MTTQPELTDLFWDCECQMNYIHPKGVVHSCDFCGAHFADQPDSHVNEVIKHMLIELSTEFDPETLWVHVNYDNSNRKEIRCNIVFTQNKYFAHISLKEFTNENKALLYGERVLSRYRRLVVTQIWLREMREAL